MRVLSVLLLLWAGLLRGADLPARLDQTGLYDRKGQVAASVRAFTPQYPLWTDGAEKTRWVLLPAGTRIQAEGDAPWIYPVGTKFWKEFRFGGRRVETRFLWKVGADQWLAGSYAWNEAQTEARLVSDGGLPGAAEVAPGQWHSIPSRSDCRLCHGNTGTKALEPLGFNALQLSTDRDPGAVRAEPLRPGHLTLKELVEERRLSPERPDLLARPPRIEAEPRTRAMLGYLSANCGACHRTDHPVPGLDMDLRLRGHVAPDQVQRTMASLIQSPGKYRLADGGTARLKPGDPEHSTLFHRMASRRPASQMPPLGSAKTDEEALAALRTWIASLPTHP